jgi:nicotinamidase-related amidase
VTESPTPSILHTLADKVNPQNCAILVVDMQNDFLHPDGKARQQGGRELGPMLDIVPRMQRLLVKAREVAVPVIFIKQTTLQGGTSNSDVWIDARSRARYSGTDMCLESSWGQQIISELEPCDADLLVNKFRYSGFVGTNLNLLLRSLGRRSVIICGTSTNVCVEATAWDAFHHEFYVLLTSDACASWDMELHHAALATAKSRYATVAETEEVLALWDSPQRS